MSRPRRILDPASLAFVLDALPDARAAFEVCGYLTALVTAPTHVAQEDWLPDLLGEDYAESEAAADAVEAVFAFYQDIHERLVRGHSIAPPAELEALIAWSRGYTDAADADPTWCNDSAASRLVGMIEDIAVTLEATLGLEDDPAGSDDADDDADAASDAPRKDDDDDDDDAPDNVVHLPPPHVALVTDEITDDDEHPGDADDAADADDTDDAFGLTPEDLEDMSTEIDDLARLAFVYWRDARGKRTVDAQPLMPHPTPVRAEPKVARNAPCPCGSGKKYKRCCGLDG